MTARGRKRRELPRYHDIAASRKPRGDAVGFAGVDIKLGLLVSRLVVTETRRGRVHAATAPFCVWAASGSSLRDCTADRRERACGLHSGPSTCPVDPMVAVRHE